MSKTRILVFSLIGLLICVNVFFIGYNKGGFDEMTTHKLQRQEDKQIRELYGKMMFNIGKIEGSEAMKHACYRYIEDLNKELQNESGSFEKDQI